MEWNALKLMHNNIMHTVHTVIFLIQTRCLVVYTLTEVREAVFVQPLFHSIPLLQSSSFHRSIPSFQSAKSMAKHSLCTHLSMSNIRELYQVMKLRMQTTYAVLDQSVQYVQISMVPELDVQISYQQPTAAKSDTYPYTSLTVCCSSAKFLACVYISNRLLFVY